VVVLAAASSGSSRTWRVAALRVLTLAGVATLLGAVHISRRPATVCLLRATTGLPCPFCGGTTAVADLGRLDLADALAASPLAVLMLAVAPVAGVVRLPRWWPDGRVRVGIILALLIASEIWQLVRFHLIAI
jgi:hypothetical protein